MFIQTPPYGFFPAAAGIKALPKGKSKGLIFIPQTARFRQQTPGQEKTGVPLRTPFLVFPSLFDL
jgi:hypothetical protein